RQAELSNEFLSRARPQGFITQTMTALEPEEPNVGIHHHQNRGYHHSVPGWKWRQVQQYRQYDERYPQDIAHRTRRKAPAGPQPVGTKPAITVTVAIGFSPCIRKARQLVPGWEKTGCSANRSSEGQPASRPAKQRDSHRSSSPAPGMFDPARGDNRPTREP